MPVGRTSTSSPQGTHGPVEHRSQPSRTRSGTDLSARSSQVPARSGTPDAPALAPWQWSSLRQPALIALGAGAGALALHLRDPNVTGSWGPAGIGLCPFQAVTGLWCPGCGGLRAVHHLTNLEFSAALSSNVLTVILVVILAIAWVRWVQLRWQGRDAARMLVLSPVASRAVVATMVVFTVLRNLPVGTILAP